MTDRSGLVLRGILRSYVQAAHVGWPTLHPDMARRVPHWPRMREPELQQELDHFLAQTAHGDCGVRVFWKLGARLTYAGGNARFAADAGVERIEEIVGLDDFDARLPWRPYAAKFRADDLQVLRSDQVRNIVERQQVGDTVHWNRVVKAAIRGEHGGSYGIFGMYETLDPAVGRLLYARQVTREDPPPLVAHA